MPLLAIKVSNKVPVSLSLEQSTAIGVDRYSAFTGAPAEDVVNSALEYVFAKDKEFQDYLEKNPELHVPETLRVRALEEPEATPKRGAKGKNQPSLL